MTVFSVLECLEGRVKAETVADAVMRAVCALFLQSFYVPSSTAVPRGIDRMMRKYVLEEVLPLITRKWSVPQVQQSTARRPAFTVACKALLRSTTAPSPTATPRSAVPP